MKFIKLIAAGIVLVVAFTVIGYRVFIWPYSSPIFDFIFFGVLFGVVSFFSHGKKK